MAPNLLDEEITILPPDIQQYYVAFVPSIFNNHFYIFPCLQWSVTMSRLQPGLKQVSIRYQSGFKRVFNQPDEQIPQQLDRSSSVSFFPSAN